ncbi:hypothetical protein, partial [Sphingobium cupriresistens]|uniref:hypothetical protein n=1 Tax=Sphingobium cupriresistens TaxID=1132417 RepID=UPI0013EBDA85
GHSVIGHRLLLQVRVRIRTLPEDRRWPPSQGNLPTPPRGTRPISASDIDNAAATIGAAIKQSVVTSDKDIGCQYGPERRDSDLCAQWKAADAAHDAAQYALWGIGIGIVGTGFLYVTFRETRRVSRAQLRAYVSIKPLGLRIKENGIGKQITAGLKVRNGGQTPAYNVVWHGNIVALTSEIAIGFFDDSNNEPLPMRNPRPTLINSNDEIDGDLESVDDLSPIDWSMVQTGAKHLYLYGTGEYRDVFNRPHENRFCYIAEHQPKLAGIVDTKKLPLVWQQAPFFNSST